MVGVKVWDGVAVCLSVADAIACVEVGVTGSGGGVGFDGLTNQAAVGGDWVIIGQGQGPVGHLAGDEFAQRFVQDALEPPKANAYA